MEAIWYRYKQRQPYNVSLILKTIIYQNIEKILTKNPVILNILAKKTMENCYCMATLSLRFVTELNDLQSTS